MDEINELVKRAAFRAALQSSRNCNDEDASDSEICVSSLADATILLQRHMGPGEAKYRRALVNYITDPENDVKSEGDLYHNFIMALCNTEEFSLALQVCEFALESAPYHRDLLGDALLTCGKSSQFDLGEQYMEKVKEIPWNLWTDTLFLYGIIFLQKKLEAYPMDDNTYERACSLADKYIENMPFDERGYNKKAEILLTRNQRSEAISELTNALFHVHPDPKDNSSELVSAQCAATLLTLLDDSNDYDFIVQVCEKGLQDTTQTQIHAMVGFFMYRKAEALDAKANKEGFRIPGTISDALRFYQSAYDLLLNDEPGEPQRGVFAHTIEQRYYSLIPFANNAQPLVRRKLYVDASTLNSAKA